MPRASRVDIGGLVYHVINRANARAQIFRTDKDYRLFESALEEAKDLTDMRILVYCLMPNHWHLVLYPRQDGDLQRFMTWLTMTHTRRWHVAHRTIGSGHLYQGRYKSFLVQTNEYFLQLCRYVERNPLRAKLVTKAEQWRWSSHCSAFVTSFARKGLRSTYRQSCRKYSLVCTRKDLYLP